ncbi:MAG TPA: hypothetical protein VF532_25045 [Candidatus Angelobacter sp.]
MTIRQSAFSIPQSGHRIIAPSLANCSGIGRRALSPLETGPRHTKAHMPTSSPLDRAVFGIDLLASNPARGDAECGAGCLNVTTWLLRVKRMEGKMKHSAVTPDRFIGPSDHRDMRGFSQLKLNRCPDLPMARFFLRAFFSFAVIYFAAHVVAAWMRGSFGGLR